MSADAHDDIIKTFILSKLEAKTLECVDPNGTGNDIINDPKKNNLKPDSSEIVSGRMLALKLNNKLTICVKIRKSFRAKGARVIFFNSLNVLALC